jgi:circadian clock protein KaiC
MNMRRQAAPGLERLSTGSSSLDEILGGGFPAGSVTVLMGEPGTGKTIFTLQMMFHLAQQGKKCLYFATLSEPALKVIRFMQQYSFFDARLLEESILLSDLGSIIRREGVEEAMVRVKERVEREEPAFVAIDSFKAIHALTNDKLRSRMIVYDLAVTVAGWEVTTFLVGEYPRSEIDLPEFAIADGIIRLGNQAQELATIRELEILKLRGTNYVTGRHFFDLSAAGLTFYPRVRAPEWDSHPVVTTSEQITTGIERLDKLLGGGLPRASASILEGSTGTGKTLMALHFLIAGARQGETGILFTLEETPEQLRHIARNFGWNLQPLEKAKRLILQHTPPVELSSDRFLNEVRQRTEELQARRVVLDSLTSIALGVSSERRFRELIYAMTKHLRASGVTSVLTMETPESFGSLEIGGHGLSPATDNLILLRFLELEGKLERAISIFKARGLHHDNRLYHFLIGKRGASVGAELAGFRGVLTGIPALSIDGPAQPRTKKKSPKR